MLIAGDVWFCGPATVEDLAQAAEDLYFFNVRVEVKDTLKVRPGQGTRGVCCQRAQWIDDSIA